MPDNSISFQMLEREEYGDGSNFLYKVEGSHLDLACNQSAIKENKKRKQQLERYMQGIGKESDQIIKEIETNIKLLDQESQLLDDEEENEDQFHDLQVKTNNLEIQRNSKFERLSSTTKNSKVKKLNFGKIQIQDNMLNTTNSKFSQNDYKSSFLDDQTIQQDIEDIKRKKIQALKEAQESLGEYVTPKSISKNYQSTINNGGRIRIDNNTDTPYFGALNFQSSTKKQKSRLNQTLNHSSVDMNNTVTMLSPKLKASIQNHNNNRLDSSILTFNIRKESINSQNLVPLSLKTSISREPSGIKLPKLINQKPSFIHSPGKKRNSQFNNTFKNQSISNKLQPFSNDDPSPMTQKERNFKESKNIQKFGLKLKINTKQQFSQAFNSMPVSPKEFDTTNNFSLYQKQDSEFPMEDGNTNLSIKDDNFQNKMESQNVKVQDAVDEEVGKIYKMQNQFDSRFTMKDYSIEYIRMISQESGYQKEFLQNQSPTSLNYPSLNRGDSLKKVIADMIADGGDFTLKALKLNSEMPSPTKKDLRELSQSFGNQFTIFSNKRGSHQPEDTYQQKIINQDDIDAVKGVNMLKSTAKKQTTPIVERFGLGITNTSPRNQNKKLNYQQNAQILEADSQISSQKQITDKNKNNQNASSIQDNKTSIYSQDEGKEDATEELQSQETFIDVIKPQSTQIDNLLKQRNSSKQRQRNQNQIATNNQYFLEKKKNWDQEIYYVIKDYQQTLGSLFDNNPQNQLQNQQTSIHPPNLQVDKKNSLMSIPSSNISESSKNFFTSKRMTNPKISTNTLGSINEQIQSMQKQKSSNYRGSSSQQQQSVQNSTQTHMSHQDQNNIMKVLKQFEAKHYHKEFSNQNSQGNNQNISNIRAHQHNKNHSVDASQRGAHQLAMPEDQINANQVEFRDRIKNYGKWYIKPEKFNRNFELIKLQVTDKKKEEQLIQRIQQVKKQREVVQPQNETYINTPFTQGKTPGSIQGLVKVQVDQFDFQKKKHASKQQIEQELIKNLENIASQLMQ
eukprot:403362167